MKALLYLGAAIALLRSVTAFLPNNNNPHDIHDQLVFQPEAVNKAVNTLEAPTEYAQVGIPASPFGADAPLNHNVASPGSEHTHPQKDMDLAAALSPHEPKFTIGTNTSQWAITYTPYTDDLACLPPTTMRSDVAAIARKGFTTIRLYSIDCSALHHIAPAARTHGLKLIIGIPLDDGPDSASAQLSDLIAWAVPTPTPNANLTSTPDATTATPPINNWPLIELIVLGNDALLNAHTTPAALSTLLTTSRSRLRTHHYPGPLTTTEPLSLLSQHAALLCPTLDVPAATIHPFFHHAVTASLAAEYVASELAHLSTLCPNLVNERAVALETGWPRRGRANGRAVPGAVEQGVAVRGIRERVGGRSVLVGWGDEAWRDGGEFGVEGSWGCGDLF